MPLPRSRRALRVLPAVVGVLLVAQVTVVATASTTGAPLDRPADDSAAAPRVTASSPSLAIDAGPVQVHIGSEGPATGPDTPNAGCGANDTPETGLQGDVPLADQLSGRADKGYNCGVDVVGYNSLGQRGGNGNMAWAGHCAYIAGDGVAVVDVSDPTNPTLVTTLHTPGSQATIETIAARTVGGRSVLVAGRYGLYFDFTGAATSPVDIYDVTDCANPKLQSTFQFPMGVHNLALTSDLSRIWSTMPLQAVDISDPTQPFYVGSLETELKNAGYLHIHIAHEATLSADDNTMYIGGQVIGDEGSAIIDITDWPQRPARIISAYAGPGHSIRPASMNGRQYLLRSDESIVNLTAIGCLPTELSPVGGPTQGHLTDITDPAHPEDVGELGLEINQPGHCAEQILSGVNASVHYHDVDDPQNTTFAMTSMWNAGLRIFDVRNPTAPQEVAYLNPGQFPRALVPNTSSAVDLVLGQTSRTALDQAWSHIRYIPESGQIWFTTRVGGFWVLQLQPQIRAELGLPSVPALAPLEGSPRPMASRAFTAKNTLAANGVYCTLGPIATL